MNLNHGFKVAIAAATGGGIVWLARKGHPDAKRDPLFVIAATAAAAGLFAGFAPEPSTGARAPALVQNAELPIFGGK